MGRKANGEKAGEQTRCRSTFYYEGKRYEATGHSQREADQKAALKLAKLKRGEIGISGNMTVRAWAEEWLETYRKSSIIFVICKFSFICYNIPIRNHEGYGHGYQ